MEIVGLNKTDVLYLAGPADFLRIFFDKIKNRLELNVKHASRLFRAEMNKHYLSYFYVNLK